LSGIEGTEELFETAIEEGQSGTASDISGTGSEAVLTKDQMDVHWGGDIGSVLSAAYSIGALLSTDSQEKKKEDEKAHSYGKPKTRRKRHQEEWENEL